MAIDVEVRSLCDFIVFKAQGAGGLPSDIHYIYRYINPSWPQYAEPHQFAILSRRGDMGIGVFPMPEWHVKEGEGISKISQKISRSTKSIFDHLNKHDKAVKHVGYCPQCG